MPTDPLTAHAEILTADAASVADCAVRLRALSRRLHGDATIPAWFAETVSAHLTACTIAADDLARAAAGLRSVAPEPPS